MRDAASMLFRGRQVGVLVGIAVAVAASGCGGGGGDGNGGSGRGGVVVAEASAAGAVEPGASTSRGALVVDVAGMVQTPGVYELPRGARVHEAIAAAGGVRPGGVLTTLNRAAEVVDGQQIVVPDGRAGSGGGGVVPAAGGAAVGGAANGAKVSLNAADVGAFDALPGIGPVTAQRIVDDRAANGPFSGVADLDRVPGIGASTIADLEPLVTP